LSLRGGVWGFAAFIIGGAFSRKAKLNKRPGRALVPLQPQ
jgi:hypothetical protein